MCVKDIIVVMGLAIMQHHLSDRTGDGIGVPHSIMIVTFSSQLNHPLLMQEKQIMHCSINEIITKKIRSNEQKNDIKQIIS